MYSHHRPPSFTICPQYPLSNRQTDGDFPLDRGKRKKGHQLQGPDIHLKAQAHARKAAKADTPTAAIHEHDQAAGQFAKAAKDTVNSEVGHAKLHVIINE